MTRFTQAGSIAALLWACTSANTRDPCDGIDCSERGTCKADGLIGAYCECEPGFEPIGLTCEPAGPTLVWPWNGYATGSLHAREDEEQHTLRPTWTWTWHHAEHVDHYELQVDDDCEPRSFQSCEFANPELGPQETSGPVEPETSVISFTAESDLPVSETAPVGRRYYWRVRACSQPEVCSSWSAVRYLDVGRAAGDFDGDGYSDMLAGAPGADDSTGFVNVYYGPPEDGSVSRSSTLLGVAKPGDRFGARVAKAGDLNGDGFADAAIGAGGADQDETMDAGAVHVYLGSGSGLGEIPTLTLRDPDPRPGGEFGANVAGVGDVNGDGYADLAVAAPQGGVRGRVLLFQGGLRGLEDEPATTLGDQRETPRGFGSIVASAADVDADGYADVLIAALDTQHGDRDGEVRLHHGSKKGLEPMARVSLRRGEKSKFGADVASAGDSDGDGFADVAVGAPGPDPAVFVFHGGPLGLSEQECSVLRDPRPQEGAAFGSSITSLGDRRGDLAVAAAHYNADQVGLGAVYTFTSSACGLQSTVSQTIENPDPVEEGSFGISLAAADLNGDGRADLVAGAAGGSGGGKAWVFLADGEEGHGENPIELTNRRVETTTEFGAAVSMASEPRGRPGPAPTGNRPRHERLLSPPVTVTVLRRGFFPT